MESPGDSLSEQRRTSSGFVKRHTALLYSLSIATASLAKRRHAWWRRKVAVSPHLGWETRLNHTELEVYAFPQSVGLGRARRRAGPSAAQRHSTSCLSGCVEVTCAFRQCLRCTRILPIWPGLHCWGVSVDRRSGRLGLARSGKISNGKLVERLCRN